MELTHFNKNHHWSNGRFLFGDGDGDGIIDDHKNQKKNRVKYRRSGNNMSNLLKNKNKNISKITSDSVYVGIDFVNQVSNITI